MPHITEWKAQSQLTLLVLSRSFYGLQVLLSVQTWVNYPYYSFPCSHQADMGNALLRILLQAQGPEAQSIKMTQLGKSKARLIWSVNVAPQPVTRDFILDKKGRREEASTSAFADAGAARWPCHQAGPFSGCHIEESSRIYHTNTAPSTFRILTEH